VVAGRPRVDGFQIYMIARILDTTTTPACLLAAMGALMGVFDPALHTNEA
jgi:hypothetical protein